MTGLALWGILGEHEARRSFAPEEGLIEELLLEFGYSVDDCLLVVEAEDLFQPASVAATRALVDALEAIDGVRAVLSIDRIPRQKSLPLARQVLPPAGSPPAQFAEARALALAHPLISGQLCARDGRTLILPILLDESRFTERRKAGERVDRVAELQAALDSVDLPGGMRANLTGAMMLAWDSGRVFDREQILYHGTAYVLVFLLATFLFRGFWAVILAGGGPVLGVLWTFGLTRILGMELSSLTLILLPIMIMMIGFTDSVHIMVHVRRERSAGLCPLEATRAAMRVMVLPCFLTTLTTGLGFASLVLAESPLVRDFGIACALGVVCTFLSVLSFLPYFASSFLGRYLIERKESSWVDGTMPFARHLFSWNLKYARSITFVGCLATGLALYVGADIETENRVAADIPESAGSTRALRRIEQAFGGSVPFHLIVSWDESVVADPAAIVAAVRGASRIVEGERETSTPFSIANLVDFLVGPEGDPASAFALLDLLPRALTRRVIHESSRAATVSVLLPDRGYRHFEPLFERVEAQFAGLAEAHPGFEFHLGGQAIVSGRRFNEFTSDLMESLALAAITIFAVLMFAFRSLRLGLISVVPNAFPLAMTAALLVLLERPMAGATAFVLSLGIAVDDTIHFMTRFRYEYAKDGDLDEALQRTVMSVGKALLMTTLVLVVGYASVLTSDFPRNRVFAAMVCITILSALFCDLVLLPAMLKTFGVGRSMRRDRISKSLSS